MKKKDTSDIGSLIKKGQFFLAQKKIEELISSEPNNLSYRNILAIITIITPKIRFDLYL